MAYYYISLEKPIYQNHQDNDKLTDISENSQLFKIFNKYIVKQYNEYYDFEKIGITESTHIFLSWGTDFIDGDQDNDNIENITSTFYFRLINSPLLTVYEKLNDLWNKSYFDSLDELFQSKVYSDFLDIRQILLDNGWKENYEHKGVCKYDENKKFIGYCTKYNLVDAHNYADEKSTIKLFEKDIPKYEKSEYNLYTKEILFRNDGLNIKEVDKLFEFGFDGYICSKSELITFINEYAINKSDFGEFISKFIDGETFFKIC
jgi:hypothetical protein